MRPNHISDVASAPASRTTAAAMNQPAIDMSVSSSPTREPMSLKMRSSADESPALADTIRDLRAAGEVVVVALPGQPLPAHTRHLAQLHSTWTIQDGVIDDPRS